MLGSKCGNGLCSELRKRERQCCCSSCVDVGVWPWPLLISVPMRCNWSGAHIVGSSEYL